MKWRARVLSELVAGAESGLLGFDFQTPEILSALLKGGVLRSGIRPEPGTDVAIDVDGLREWRTLVPYKGGALAHADGRKAISLSHAEAMLYLVDRSGLYRTMVDDLSCRPDIRELAVGIWQLGTFQHPDGTRSKVLIVEQGTPPNTVVQQVQALQYTCVFLLGVGKATESLDSLNKIAGKTILHGQIETDGNRFYCTAMDEAEDLATPSRPDTYIDTKVFPPILVMQGVTVKLPIKGKQVSDGVLFLEYLFDHPRDVISAWDLEGAVFPDRREKQAIIFGVDDRMSPEAEEKLKSRARDLQEILNDRHASDDEKGKAIDELEQINEELSCVRSQSGTTKQLGTSDGQRATGRVRKALDKVVESVRGQNAELGQALHEAVDRATEVQFRPPPDWGL
jgi:hypothetical protein